MRAGSLDRRVTVERAGLTTDEFGQDLESWAPLAIVWAAKEDIRDSEMLAAQQVGATVTTRFRIRWSQSVASLTPRDRLVYAGRAYQVVAVKEIGRRVGLEVTATAEAD
jgi:SPP1 family predicted phage head-tail adaptor